jgi:acyl dehydratase
MTHLHYEDIVEGSVQDFGPRTITREEMIAYAREFDSQPMHLDEEAAKKSLLGGLAASGWHTCCFMFRMMYDYVVKDSASLGSPGIEETKWLKPVRPDSELTLRMQVLDKRISKSRPDMGIVRTRTQLLDESGAAVIDQTSTLLISVRDPQKAAAQ